MAKRVRLNEDVLDLKTTKVELSDFKERAEQRAPARFQYQDQHTTINKEPLRRLVADYIRMKKLLKAKGFTVNHALHYNETKEFKQGLKESDIPKFLQKEKVANAKVESTVKKSKHRRRRVRA